MTDLDVLLELVAECGEVADPAALAVAVLKRLPDLVACDSCSWNKVPGPGGDGRMLILCEPEEIVFPGAAEALEAHSGEHPLMVHYARTGDGRARQLSEFLSRRQLHDLGLWTDVYRHLGVEAQLSVAVPLGADGFIGIALSRSGADFTDRDRQVLDLLRPHLVTAYTRVARRRPGPGEGVPVADRFGLTQREAQVLDLVCTGATNVQVARRLAMSPRTVQAHLGAVFKKMGVETRTSAAALAREWVESASEVG